MKKILIFINNLTKPHEYLELHEKVLIARILGIIEFTLGFSFRIGSTLIVTRILSPDIFGLFVIIIMFQAILVMVTDFGVRSLIIVSDHGKDPDFLRTCWSVQAIRGICIWLLIIILALGLWGLQQAGAVPTDTVYGASDLPLALAISGFALVLQGLISVNVYVYEKEMRFRLVTTMNIIVAAANPALTILIALVHPSIWALVISSILGGLLHVILSFCLFDGPPMRFFWHQVYRKELFTRGKWILSHSLLTVAATSADKLMLGGFVPPSVMGTYFLATQFVGLVQGLILKLMASTGLQFFSELIDQKRVEARHKYYRYRIPFDLIAFFVAGGMLTAGPAVINLLYDPRYLEAGTIMQILAIGLPLNVLNLIRSAFSAQKRFQIMTLVSMVQVMAIWFGLFLALFIFENVFAAFIVIALHRLPEMSVLLWLANRDGWISILQEIRFVPVMILGGLLGWSISFIIGTPPF